MIQENRSFDNLFATFPGADGATQGKLKRPAAAIRAAAEDESGLICATSAHSYQGVLKDYDGGAMDGFA